MVKARNDSTEWSHAQILDDKEVRVMETTRKETNKGWIPPDVDWLKCDIGVAWDEKTKTSGASWVIRNSSAEVVMNSRRSFVSVSSLIMARCKSWLWAIESMRSLHYSKIIFVVDAMDLIGAVTRPPAWPSFKWFSNLVCRELVTIPDWQLIFGSGRMIRGASLIANSVIREDMLQSYVAVGGPCWLRELFNKDRLAPL